MQKVCHRSGKLYRHHTSARLGCSTPFVVHPVGSVEGEAPANLPISNDNCRSAMFVRDLPDMLAHSLLDYYHLYFMGFSHVTYWLATS